jgi:sulfofructose kinase
MKVLGIGEIILDVVNLVASYPTEGPKIDCFKTDYSVGGSVPSALILLSRLGVNCTPVGSLGNDSFAQRIKKELEKEKISVFSVPQNATKIHTVVVDSQTSSRTIIKNNLKTRPVKNISSELIKSADLIIADRHEPEAFKEILSKKRKSTKIVIDPSCEVSKKTLEMIKLADFPIIPIEFLSKFKEEGLLLGKLKELYRIAQKKIVVTVGEKGCLIYNGKKIDFFPAYDVRAIDTLGAGDIFRGAFGFGVLNNWNIEKCASFANKVAALQCLKLGNSTAIPTKKEIIEFEKTAMPKNISLKELTTIQF